MSAEKAALLDLRDTLDACAVGRADLAEAPLMRLASGGSFFAASLSDGSTPLGLAVGQ